MNEYPKVWFDKEKNWFEVFTPSGEQIAGVKGVSVSDNWTVEKGSALTVSFDCNCKVVDERPVFRDPNKSKCEQTAPIIQVKDSEKMIIG